MPRKTEGVYVLVLDVLQSFTGQHTEDVTDDVCIAIEENPEWRLRYDRLVEELEEWEVNKYLGRYTKRITGRVNLRVSRTPKSSLIESYTKLVPQ